MLRDPRSDKTDCTAGSELELTAVFGESFVIDTPTPFMSEYDRASDSSLEHI